METELSSELESSETRRSRSPIKQGAETPVRDAETTTTQPLDARQDSVSIPPRGEDDPERESAPAKVRFLLSLVEASVVVPIHATTSISSGLGKPSSRSSPPPRRRSSSILLSKNRGRDTRSTRQSVFERLSQMDTVASSQMKLVPKALLVVRKRASSAPATLRSPSNKPPTGKVKTELKLKNSDVETNISKPNKVSPNIATFERLAERHTKLSMMRHESSRKIAAQRSGVRGVLRASSASTIAKGRPAALERWTSAPNIIRVDEIITKEEESVCAQSVISAGPQLEVGCTSGVDNITTNTLRPDDGLDQADCLEPALDKCPEECESGGTKRREKVATKKKVTIMGIINILPLLRRGMSSLYTTCEYMLKLTILFVGK